MRKFFDRLPIALTPYALIYPLLAFLAFLFAQGLKMPISYTVFVFVLLLPLISVLQLILARLTLRVSFRTSAASLPKRTPLHIYAMLHSRCPLPLSQAEAVLTLPVKDGRRTADTVFIMTLLPFSTCRLERNAEFAFRGEYRIGFKCVYVYDFMRAIRIRIPVNCGTDIFVLPRKLTLDPSPHSGQTDSAASRTPMRGGDNTELTDIRTYETGDNKKLIHWKLSTKSEELLVKDFTDIGSSSVAILCDLEPFTKANAASDAPRVLKEEFTETADLYCTDLVIETALAAARRELEAGLSVTLAWFECGAPVFIQINSDTELDAQFRRFASASHDTTEHQTAKLSKALENEAYSFSVIVSPILDSAHAQDYLNAASAIRFSSVGELHLCAPRALFCDSDAEQTVCEYIKELSNEGFDIITARSI